LEPDVPGIRDPYTLTFTVEETELVLQGLGKLPAERSYNLLTRLGQEIAKENQYRQNPPSSHITGSDMPTAAAPDAPPVQ
jgi:hypothetical protein